MTRAQLKRIARLALFGVIGFGIPAGISFVVPSFLVTFIIEGAFGGLVLGLALKKDNRKVAALVLLGAVGFGSGSLIGFSSSWIEGEPVLAALVFGSVTGVIGGEFLGLALWSWRKMMGLAIAGAIGFGLGAIIVDSARFSLWMILMAIIGGACLGATLGFLEKE